MTEETPFIPKMWSFWGREWIIRRVEKRVLDDTRRRSGGYPFFIGSDGKILRYKGMMQGNLILPLYPNTYTYSSTWFLRTTSYTLCLKKIVSYLTLVWFTETQQFISYQVTILPYICQDFRVQKLLINYSPFYLQVLCNFLHSHLYTMYIWYK